MMIVDPVKNQYLFLRVVGGDKVILMDDRVLDSALTSGNLIKSLNTYKESLKMTPMEFYNKHLTGSFAQKDLDKLLYEAKPLGYYLSLGINFDDGEEFYELFHYLVQAFKDKKEIRLVHTPAEDEKQPDEICPFYVIKSSGRYFNSNSHVTDNNIYEAARFKTEEDALECAFNSWEIKDFEVKELNFTTTSISFWNKKVETLMGYGAYEIYVHMGYGAYEIYTHRRE